MNLTGLRRMIVITWRTRWRAALAWTGALAALMVLTTVSISTLYDTQDAIDTYARSVGAGNALLLLNGEVAGLDTLGGVVANEFGFVASLALPLMGVSLIARTTRRDEEAGRLELLVAGGIGRAAPPVAAVVVATGALLLTAVALVAGMWAVGVDRGGAVLYAASLALLGLVFVGIAALVAQLVPHARDVTLVALGVVVLSYVLRGVGDVRDNALTWLSPLGWAEQTRAFGQARWWPVVLPLAVAAVLIASACTIAATRDLGSAVMRRASGPPMASAALRRPLGLALHLHRTTIAAWVAGTVAACGMFGLLAGNIVDAMAGNPALARALGGPARADTFLSFAVLMLVLLSAGYVVQAVGTMRGEEAAGRLEPLLAGATTGRLRWCGAHLVVVGLGLVLVAGIGGVVLSASVRWSTGTGHAGALATAVGTSLPAALVLAAVAVLLAGALPRAFVVAWLAYAFATAVPLLGDALRLPHWLRMLAPTAHVGAPPLEAADPAALVVLVAVAAALSVAGLVAFARRDVPSA